MRENGSAPVKLRPTESALYTLVNDRLHAVLAGFQNRELRDILTAALWGGKRVRPVLTCLACEAAGGNAEDALDAGVAIEMLHCSSCIHDDIMDQSTMRRGRPTVHVAHGTSLAILAGDTLTALAFRSILRQRSPRTTQILSLLVDAFVDLCDGQAGDILSMASAQVDGATHQRMVENKTARLLEASCAIGALITTDNVATVRSLAEFGLQLGFAFQAQDDLLDVIGTEETLGKPVGVDQRNGRRTYLALAYPEVDPVARTQNLVRTYTQRALDALHRLPDSPAREKLGMLAASLTDRRR